MYIKVWRETLCQRDMLAALKRKRTRLLGGGYGTSLIDNVPSSTSASSSSATSGSGIGSASSGASSGSGSSHGAAMEAMNGALDLGDAQLVIIVIVCS